MKSDVFAFCKNQIAEVCEISFLSSTLHSCSAVVMKVDTHFDASKLVQSDVMDVHPVRGVRTDSGGRGGMIVGVGDKLERLWCGVLRGDADDRCLRIEPRLRD